MHRFNLTHASQLNDYVRSYGCDLDAGQIELLLRHAELVLSWNTRLNLTRITDPHEVLVKHIVDSLLFAVPFRSIWESSGSMNYLDIGTGAGYPGIPIALLTGCHGLLIDSVNKKCDAVRQMVMELGLSGQLGILSTRAEDLATSQPGQFGIVVSRAVADLATLLEYARPLLRDDGVLITSVGNVDDIVRQHAQYVSDICGFRWSEHRSMDLPASMGVRQLFTFTVVSESLVSLPRRPGMASKRPLWLRS